jgi:hypothetical protein
MKYLLSIFAVLMLAGCAVDDAVARSEQALTEAQQLKAEVDRALVAAVSTAKGLQKLAEGLDAARAAEVTQQANDLVAQAQAASKRVGDTLAVAEKATEAAKAAQAAGGGALDVLIGAASILVPGTGGALMLLRQLGRAKTAIRLTAAHADRMEEAETSSDVIEAKMKAQREQALHGVAYLIEKARS